MMLTMLCLVEVWLGLQWINFPVRSCTINTLRLLPNSNVKCPFFLQLSIRAPSPMSLVHVESLVHHGYSLSLALVDKTWMRTVSKTSSFGGAVQGLGHLSLFTIHTGPFCHSSRIREGLPPRLGKSAGFHTPGQCRQWIFQRSDTSLMADTLFATQVVHTWAGFWSQCHTVMLSTHAFTSVILMRSSLWIKSMQRAPRKAACISSLTRLSSSTEPPFPLSRSNGCFCQRTDRCNKHRQLLMHP